MLTVGLGCVLGARPCAAAPAQGYNYFVVGNPADVVTPTSGLLVPQGGGTDVDENFVRMGARSGGGDFVVIRASGSDGYNPYIFDLCGCDSVETIVFKNRQAAYDEFVLANIRNAEALFIAGGDQSEYVTFWKNTPVEDAIHHVAAKPAPIGGTSAGMAIMSEFVYSAMSAKSLTSAGGLSNPFHRDLTLDARLPGPAAARRADHRPAPAGARPHGPDGRLPGPPGGGRLDAVGRAIAADRETALHVDPADGSAEVFATPTHPTPYVYFLQTPGPPEVCAPKTPLTYRNISVYRIGPGGRFEIPRWNGTGGIAYTLSAEAGVLVSSRGDIY